MKITMMRLWHCRFRDGLVLIGKHLDGKCQCGEPEIVRHELLNCKRFSEQRKQLSDDFSELSEAVFNLQNLLSLEDWKRTKNS